MTSDLERLPAPVSAAAPGAGLAALAGELLRFGAVELPLLGDLEKREQLLVSAWLTGLRSAHPPRLRRGHGGLARLAGRAGDRDLFALLGA